jgi:hypothetical protein
MPVLSVDRVVRVSVNLQPKAAPRRGFGVLCIVTSEDVISVEERLRFYTSLDGVISDFGMASQAYRAAQLFFAQSPKPFTLAVARWDRGTGNPVAPPEEIPPGSEEEGQEETPGEGQAESQGASQEEVQGEGQGESPAACVAALADMSADWYGLAFAAAVASDVADRLTDEDSNAIPQGGVTAGAGSAAGELSIEDHLAVAAFIEATSKSRVYFCTETDATALSAVSQSDLPSRLKELKYQRSFCQYGKNPNAAVSAAARAFTVNFNANRSTITLKFKQEPGVVAEGLTETQAKALADKNCNVFVRYDNDTAILQEGVVSSGAYFDEIHGLDWLQNAIQTECYNLLYQSKTKIPQTDGGVAQLVAGISHVMGEAINNGLVAPGAWNADGFGLIERGDYLPDGYYIYAQSVDDQPQSEREQRKAPPIQVAVKLAGAIHSVDVIVDVNR